MTTFDVSTNDAVTPHWNIRDLACMWGKPVMLPSPTLRACPELSVVVALDPNGTIDARGGRL